MKTRNFNKKCLKSEIYYRNYNAFDCGDFYEMFELNYVPSRIFHRICVCMIYLKNCACVECRNL